VATQRSEVSASPSCAATMQLTEARHLLRECLSVCPSITLVSHI